MTPDTLSKNNLRRVLMGVVDTPDIEQSKRDLSPFAVHHIEDAMEGYTAVVVIPLTRGEEDAWLDYFAGGA